MNTTDLVVDPRDGTVLAVLSENSTGLLAEIALELKAREQGLHQMRELVEAELAQRVQNAGRKVVVVENLELRIDSTRSRVWDGDELETAVRDLVDQGVLRAGELTGLITHEVKVDGRMAQRLLGLLHGPALSTVEQCFSWQTKGRPRLIITPCTPLLEGNEDAV